MIRFNIYKAIPKLLGKLFLITQNKDYFTHRVKNFSFKSKINKQIQIKMNYLRKSILKKVEILLLFKQRKIKDKVQFFRLIILN